MVHHQPEIIWVWGAQEPSETELKISEHIKKNYHDDGVFLVSALTFQNTNLENEEIYNTIPKSIECRNECSIVFAKYDDKSVFRIPIAEIHHPRDGAESTVRYNFKEFHFQSQLVIFIVSKRDPQQRESSKIYGHWEAIGLLSVLFGSNLHNTLFFSTYFHSKDKKFMSGDVYLKKKTNIEFELVNFNYVYNCAELNTDNDASHTALWFAGRAFSEKSALSKIIMYQAALEAAARSKRAYDIIPNMYKRSLRQKLKLVIRNLANLRNDILHKGIISELGGDQERYIQSIIIDTVVMKTNSDCKSTFFEKLIEGHDVTADNGR